MFRHRVLLLLALTLCAGGAAWGAKGKPAGGTSPARSVKPAPTTLDSSNKSGLPKATFPTFSLLKAIDMIGLRVPGTFTEAGEEQGATGPVWVLTLLGQNQKPYEARVDALNGWVTEIAAIEYSEHLQKNPQRTVPLSLADAAKMGLSRVEGMAMGVSLVDAGGRLVWQVLVGPEKPGGKEHEVIVSSDGPEVLAVDGRAVPKDGTPLPPRRAKVTLAEAIAAIGKRVPGSFSAAALDRDKDRVLWRIALLGPDKKPYETSVDAETGKVVEIVRYEYSEQFDKNPLKTTALPLDDAIAAATAQTPGYVADAGVGDNAGKPVWNLTVVENGSSDEHSVAVAGDAPKVVSLDGKLLDAPEKAAAPPERKVRLAQALVTARRQVEGALIAAAALEDEQGPTWELAIMAGDRKVHDVSIDGADGRVTRVAQLDYSMEYQRNPPILSQLPVETAVQIAEKTVPGEVVAAQTDRDAARVVWTMTVLGRSDGREHEVEVAGPPAVALSVDGSELPGATRTAANTNPNGTSRTANKGKKTTARKPKPPTRARQPRRTRPRTNYRARRPAYPFGYGMAMGPRLFRLPSTFRRGRVTMNRPTWNMPRLMAPRIITPRRR